MSFAIYFQGFAGGDASEGGEAEMRAVLRPHVASDEGGLLRVKTADGEADISLDDSCMMATHVSGDDTWDLLVRGAAAANWVILPTGCSICLTDAQQALDLPADLAAEETVVVNSGADLLTVIRSIDDGMGHVLLPARMRVGNRATRRCCNCWPSGRFHRLHTAVVTSPGDWPRDPRLDPFRDAVWELSRGGHVEAFLTTQVSHMRSFPIFWVRREWLWYQVNWVDGRRDEPDEDYGPGWYAVAELEQNRLEHDGNVFDAKPVEGADRFELWQRYGPP